MKILAILIAALISLCSGQSPGRAAELDVALAELLRQADQTGARHPQEASIVRTIQNHLLTKQVLGQFPDRQLQPIRVYIIDATKLSLDPALSGKAHDLARSVIDNAEALPHAIILLDSAFVNELLINAKNEIIGLAESTHRYFEAEKEGGAASKVALGFMVRNEAYDNWLRLWRLDKANAANQATRQPQMESNIAGVYQAQKAMGGEEFELGFAGALAPVIYHEVGHLLDGSSGPFLEDLTAWINGQAAVVSGTVKLRIEAEADRKAARLIRAFLDTIPDLERGTVVLPGITATLEELRDQVISFLYQDFRSLSARELRVTLYHNLCKPDVNVTSPGFDQTDSINHAYINADPIITRAEFMAMRSLVLAQYGDQSHPHGFRRASEIYDVMKAYTTLPLYKSWLDARSDVIHEDELVLNAALANDPAIMARQETSSTRGIFIPREIADIPAQPYYDYLASLFQLEEGANCSAFRCYTGKTLVSLQGFAEIAETQGRFLYARMTFRLFGADPEGRANGSDPEGYAYGMILFLRTLLTAAQLSTGVTVDNATAPDFVADMASFRREVIECGFSSRFYVAGRLAIAVTTVREGDWISFVMQPSPQSMGQQFILEANQDKKFTLFPAKQHH